MNFYKILPSAHPPGVDTSRFKSFKSCTFDTAPPHILGMSPAHLALLKSQYPQAKLYAFHVGSGNDKAALLLERKDGQLFVVKGVNRRYIDDYKCVDAKAEHRPDALFLETDPPSDIVVGCFEYLTFNPVDFSNDDHVDGLIDSAVGHAKRGQVVDINDGNFTVVSGQVYYVDVDINYISGNPVQGIMEIAGLYTNLDTEEGISQYVMQLTAICRRFPKTIALPDISAISPRDLPGFFQKNFRLFPSSCDITFLVKCSQLLLKELYGKDISMGDLLPKDTFLEMMIFLHNHNRKDLYLNIQEFTMDQLLTSSPLINGLYEQYEQCRETHRFDNSSASNFSLTVDRSLLKSLVESEKHCIAAHYKLPGNAAYPVEERAISLCLNFLSQLPDTPLWHTHVETLKTEFLRQLGSAFESAALMGLSRETINQIKTDPMRQALFSFGECLPGLIM